MYELKKTMTFSAAHCLSHLPLDHPCGRLHGHNYSVTVTLRSDYLDKHGFVTDLNVVGKALKRLVDNYDHTNLQDTFVGRSTCEVMARFFYDCLLAQLGVVVYSVTVSEGPSSSVTYWDDPLDVNDDELPPPPF